MIWRGKGTAVVAIVVSLGFLLLVCTLHESRVLAQSAAKSTDQTAQGPKTKTAAEVYKNIKVLKNIPAYELIPTMEFIAASLGVRCDYCHVEHHFDEDTKRTKRRAREMMQMMFAIDKDHFHGHLVVTCNTCHHGSEHPEGIPAIAEAAEVQARPAHLEEHGKRMNLAALPHPPAIIARYVEALGGASALRKIKSRVIIGTMTAFGHAMPVEIYAKAPDLRASVMKFPHGQSVMIYNGHEGWASMMPRPPHYMEGSELDKARLEADFYFPLDIQRTFRSLRERPPQKVGEEEAYVVFGIRPGKPPVQLFFGKQSGLLLRMVYFTQTALGRLPQQTDYSDYRDVNGLKVPFRWTVAQPLGWSTVQVTRVQQNVPIRASRFSIPKGHGSTRQ